VISISQTSSYGSGRFSSTRAMKLDSGSPIYPFTFFPRSTIFPSLHLNAKLTIFLNKEPSSPHLETPPYRVVSEDDFSPESSNIHAFPSHLRSISFHKSPLPIIHVLHEGKPGHFFPLHSIGILFRPVGR
jgi:hypothetical protein